jgi:uncharacterized oxidoreductase
VPVFADSSLLLFACELLSAGGGGAGANTVARSLVDANLRGHDSHGVMRIPFYVGQIKEGKVQPNAALTIEKETAGTLVCDGGWGFGQVLCRDLTARLIKKAEASGIAAGFLRQSAHCGRLGEYAEQAAERDMVTFICANTHGAGQRVAPVGGKRPVLGTNPLCVGMPGGEDGPFILDFGTSATAEGKVRVRKIAGQPVPSGWLLNSEGRPTNDPNDLYASPPGSILPMGGDQAYKGFGLAYMIEMLCGALSGGPCSHPNPPPPVGNCVTIIVISPEQTGGLDHLTQEVGQLETFVRAVPLREGADRITLPGDPERLTMEKRRKDGIPIDDGNWAALCKLAQDLGVATPAV